MSENNIKYCEDCTKYHTKKCTNVFPNRVKPNVKACEQFEYVFDKDRTYCHGSLGYDNSEGRLMVKWCPLKNRCKRFMEGFLISIYHEAWYDNPNAACAKKGYKLFIKKRQ